MVGRAVPDACHSRENRNLQDGSPIKLGMTTEPAATDRPTVERNERRTRHGQYTEGVGVAR